MDSLFISSNLYLRLCNIFSDSRFHSISCLTSLRKSEADWMKGKHSDRTSAYFWLPRRFQKHSPRWSNSAGHLGLHELEHWDRLSNQRWLPWWLVQNISNPNISNSGSDNSSIAPIINLAIQIHLSYQCKKLYLHYAWPTFSGRFILTSGKER